MGGGGGGGGGGWQLRMSHPSLALVGAEKLVGFVEGMDIFLSLPSE